MLKSFCLSFGLVASLIIGSSAYANSSIVVGSYYNGFTSYPLIAYSQDKGESWNYVIDSLSPTLPPDFKNGHFLKASCSGSYCVAVGYSYEGITSMNPLIAASVDGGLSWAYTMDNFNSKTPEDYQQAILLDVSCSGAHCVASGHYTDSKFNWHPLLVSSHDGGLSWSFNHTVPPEFTNGQFSGTSCSGLNCVAAGYYNGSPGLPLLAHSKDRGNTWTYVIDSKKPSPPADFKWGSFTNASCSKLHCIAVGTYGNDSQREGNYDFGYPLIANSIDGGANWIYSLDSTKPNLPTDYKRGEFLDASCSKMHCVAVGFYYDETTPHPLLANSADGGNTWTYPSNDKALNLPEDLKEGKLSSVACTRLSCIAAGGYTNGSSYQPLLLSSKDGGTSWYSVVDSSKLTLPTDFKMDSSFTGVSCSGLYCLASGSYSNGSNYYPLVATSKDGGTSWIYSLDSSKPGLPVDFKTGMFSNAGISFGN